MKHLKFLYKDNLKLCFQALDFYPITKLFRARQMMHRVRWSMRDCSAMLLSFSIPRPLGPLNKDTTKEKEGTIIRRA